MLSIGVELARRAPLSINVNRALYKDLVITDNPFHIQFALHLIVLLTCPRHTLTAVAVYGNAASLNLLSSVYVVCQTWISLFFSFTNIAQHFYMCTYLLCTFLSWRPSQCTHTSASFPAQFTSTVKQSLSYCIKLCLLGP